MPEPAENETAPSVFERDVPGADLGLFGPIATASAWAHYVAVFDGAQARLYVNGELASTTPAQSSLAPRTSPFTVPRGSGGADFFSGVLDEVAVYDRALEVGPIAGHFALAK